MQHPKPFFEVFEKLLVCGVQCSIARCHKVLSVKAAAFALIFIPCLLQFPLIVFGQNGSDRINGCLVPFKCVGESVHSEKVIADGGNFSGEGGFISGDGRTEDISFVPPQGKPMGGQHTEQDASDSEQRDVILDHWTSMLLLIFGAWAAISPTVEKRKIK
jgi:hypothetical protein